MALFRTEAMIARSRALEGEVALAAPLPWRVAGGVLLALVAGGLLWLTLGRIAQVRTITLIAGADGVLVGAVTGDPLPPGACGAAGDAHPASPVSICLIGPPGRPMLARIGGRLVQARPVRARASRAIAPGTRVTARLPLGRTSPAALLW